MFLQFDIDIGTGTYCREQRGGKERLGFLFAHNNMTTYIKKMPFKTLGNTLLEARSCPWH